MEYSVLTVGIETKLEPTENIIHPTSLVTRYTSDATITSFDNELVAMQFASNYWPGNITLALPGDKDGLKLYEQLWMGIGEECLQNVERLANSLMDFTAYNWSFGKEDRDSLDEAIEDHEEQERGDELVEGTSQKVGSYAMDRSELTWYESSAVYLLGHTSTDNFEDLTPEEQALVITEDSKDKAIVTVSMGAMFDLWCLKKFNGNVIEAMAYATMFSAKNDLSSKKYQIEQKVETTVRDYIKKLNQIRIDNGWL